MDDITLKVKKLVPHAIIPTKAHEDDAGFDLYLAEEVIIPPHSVARGSTGVAIELPYGLWAFIKERGSTALKANVMTLAGIVDGGYRGEIILALFNIGDSPVHFHAGDRVAQYIPTVLVLPDIKEVSELSDSTRGHGGFGSTGQ